MTFLEQLQQSAGLLNNQISNTDTTQIKSLFGNYNPMSASDYVVGPMGGIAQNRFEGNQFQMPNLFNAQYIPEAFNQGSLLQTPSSNNMGTYNPGQFNQYGNIPVTGNIPSNVSTTTMQDRGSNESDRRQLERSQGRYSYETYAGKTFRVDNNTGQVEEADFPLGTASLLGKFFGSIPGVENYRIENMTPEDRAALMGAYSDAVSRDQRNVDLEDRIATSPTTYGYTGPVAQTGLLGALSRVGKDKVSGKGTKATTAAAARSAAQTQKDIAKATKEAAKKQGSKNNGRNRGTVDRGGKSKGSGGFGGKGDGAGGACFEPNTYIKMQDGSEKKIKDVQLGDFTKGGKVTGVLQFEPIDDIHEYKGVIVAGSHFVKEGNEFIMVQDSPESIKIDKIPVVYSLDTSNRRIFINDIEFADYNGDGIAKNFLNNAGIDLSGFDKEVLRQVEHRLI